MSFALYPSDAATAAPSDSPALRPAQPAPTLVEGQGCCQEKAESNISKLESRPSPQSQGEEQDQLAEANTRCVTTAPVADSIASSTDEDGLVSLTAPVHLVEEEEDEHEVHDEPGDAEPGGEDAFGFRV